MSDAIHDALDGEFSGTVINVYGTQARRASYDSILAKHPQVSHGEILQLIARVRAGDEQARQKIIEGNLRLIAAIVRRKFKAYAEYSNAKISADDLFQEGVIGLNRAIDKFNPEFGFRFSTYATPWIIQAVGRAIQDNGQAVRIPVHLQDAMFRAVRYKCVRELREKIKRQDISDAVWEHIRKELEIESLRPHQIASMLGYADIDENDWSLCLDEIAESGNGGGDNTGLREDMARALAGLRDRERTVMMMLFGWNDRAPMTLEAVGKEMGCTRENVRQIRKRALRKMKEEAPELAAYCGN